MSISVQTQAAVLDRVDRPTGVAAWGNVVVWSRFDSSTHRYRLVARTGDRTRVLNVRPRKVAFDADVGPGTNGQATVVYSRCRQETPNTELSEGLGCDLYAFDPRGQKERKLAKPSSAEASETRPTLDHGRLVFVRVYERRKGVRGVLPHIILLRGQRERELSGGPRGIYDVIYRGGRRPRPPRSDLDMPSGPFNLNISGSTLAYTWDRTRVICPSGSSNTEEVTQSEIRAIRLGSDADADKHAVIDSGCSADPKNKVSGSSNDGSAIAYSLINGSQCLRVIRESGDLQLQCPESMFVLDTAVGLDCVVAVVQLPDHTVEVREYADGDLLATKM